MLIDRWFVVFRDFASPPVYTPLARLDVRNIMFVRDLNDEEG